MRHVVGLSSILVPGDTTPLDLEGRIQFDTGHQQTMGYVEIIAPSFDEFAHREYAFGQVILIGSREAARIVCI